MNDGGVHDRAFAHEQPALGEQTVDLHEQPLSELMDFQQSPKAQDGRLIRGGVGVTGDADEAAHHDRIIERFLGCRVGQV